MGTGIARLPWRAKLPWPIAAIVMRLQAEPYAGPAPRLAATPAGGPGEPQPAPAKRLQTLHLEQGRFGFGILR
jgi:hypothetical protein